ncbi:MAG: VCBS repeat-containing protein, partial [Thermoguttaceae bacterium]|nr:VCBS repeat-containing protein [Thermoguttaceae bacterium]
MKVRLFQRISNKSGGSQIRARRLKMEALENRELLNVDWGGLASEIRQDYSSQTSGYVFEFGDRRADVCDLTDMDGDGVDELVSVQYGVSGGGAVTVYKNNGSGVFSAVKTTTISELSDDKTSSATAIADVDGDGIADLVVVSQNYDSWTLNASAVVYKGSANGSFVKGATKSLDVSKFANDGLFFASLDAVVVQNAATGQSDLVLVGSAYDAIANQLPRKAFVYAGVGSSSFGSTATAISISSRASTQSPQPVCAATIGGVGYAVSIDSTAGSSNAIVLTNVASKTSYSFDLSAAGGNFAASWADARDGHIVIGGTKNGVSGVLTMNVVSATAGTATYTWVEHESLNANGAIGAVGDLNGRSGAEVIVINGSAYELFQGDSSYRFTLIGSETANPNYKAIYVGDYDGDGYNNALVVGETGIYASVVDDDGQIGDATQIYTLGSVGLSVDRAVFGDFNGDGKIDVAIYCKSVGSESSAGYNARILQQIAGGRFAQIASFSTTGFQDFAVGRFTQTAKDELAILTRSSSGVDYLSVAALSSSGIS